MKLRSNHLTIGLLVAGAGVASVSCKDKEAKTGLPPATQWQAPAAGAAIGGMPAGDPHAGIPGAPSLSGGGAGGVDVGALGMPPPDPNRAIDATKYVRGTLSLSAALKDAVPPGAVIFLSLRAADANGQAVAGPPIAVDRLTIDSWPIDFDLNEAKAMVAGTHFPARVVVQARVDNDSDAISKNPGDLVGQAVVDVPSTDVKLVFSTKL
ncbi:MAG: hypothetical protein IPL79_03540 [Myxococcales bacterium]|nr:hypothetical protein [Myxococcales bacterium]